VFFFCIFVALIVMHLLQKTFEAAFACCRTADGANDGDANSLWISWLFTWLCTTTGLHVCTAICNFTTADARKFTMFLNIFRIICCVSARDTVEQSCVCFRLLSAVVLSLYDCFVLLSFACQFISDE